ncbi:efflux RND transporter periplasmic adaptor subunit [Roseivirga echinicomitans]
MKTYQYILLAFVAFLTVSCGTTEQKEITQLPSVPVKVAQVNGAEAAHYIAASGKVEAGQNASLSTRVMGNVTKVHVKVGDKVSKGQTLISISNADLTAQKAQVDAAIIQAESGLKNAEKDFQRFKTLFEKGSASQKELDDMTTRYEVAKANVEAALQMKKGVEAQFAYSTIIAPFSGAVVNSYIKEGMMANPGMPLIALEDAQNYQVVASISESDISGITSDTKAKIFVKSIEREYEGNIIELSPSAQHTGGQYLVKIAIQNADKALRSGMFVNVKFESNSTEKGASQVMIPTSALVKNGQLTGVYVVTDEQIAILRWLRLGRTYNNKVEVISGIAENERFILSHEGKLYNGAKVTF